MKKRFFALLLSGLLCLGLCSTAFAADDNGHWDFSDPSVGPQWVPDNPTPIDPNPPTPPTPSGPNNNDYEPSTPSIPNLPVSTDTTTQDGTSITNTTATPNASVQGNTATASVDSTTGNEIVKQAVANRSENVIIAPKITGSVSKTEVTVPAATLEQIGSKTNANLTVSTPVADVTIPNGGLGSLSSGGGTVTVTAEQIGNSVELAIMAGGCSKHPRRDNTHRTNVQY